jgi:hypothetical protein
VAKDGLADYIRYSLMEGAEARVRLTDSCSDALAHVIGFFTQIGQGQKLGVPFMEGSRAPV